jgi:hypothetical protein
MSSSNYLQDIFLLISVTHLFSASANGIVEMANRAKVMTRQILEAI